jgi:hypothetical protein
VPQSRPAKRLSEVYNGLVMGVFSATAAGIIRKLRNLRARPAIGCQVAQQRRGAADRGEYREVAKLVSRRRLAAFPFIC